MNLILLTLLLLLIIPAIRFMSRTPRKNAIKRCVALAKKIKRAADYAGPGDESALDEYHELLELARGYGIRDEEISIQNKTVVAQQALIAFTNYIVTCKNEHKELLMQMAQEFHEEFLGGPFQHVPHGMRTVTAH